VYIDDLGSVKAQFPTASSAQIKMDIRQKLQNAVKTVKRNLVKTKQQESDS